MNAASLNVVLAYLGVILIWSTTPLAIKFSAQTLSATAAVGLRMALAAVICVLLSAALRQALRWDRQALLAYAAANLGVVGAMILVYSATAYIPSGLISVIFGLAPLLSGLLARPILGEAPFTRQRIAALLLALFGLGLVFDGELRLPGNPVPGLLASLGAVFLFSLSGVLVKRYAVGLSALTHTTGSLLLSLPLFALAWLLLDGETPSEVSALSVSAVIYLAVMGSVLGFMLYFFVLQRLRATQVALIPLITPVLAVSLGARLADEVIGRGTLIGGTIILLALAIYQLGGSKRPRRWLRGWRSRAAAGRSPPLS